ncbi:Cyclic di-AMP synthase CdaA [termite gut metagenome]|uniref:Cyclic di-AMP synthase CdaA n=1 Tax=termite gut metagenome TaxID=433724 RepID=A0A5J4QQU8_9ZZZZ
MPFVVNFKNCLDILLVTFFVFYIYRLMKSSGSLNIFVGIMIIVLTWLAVSFFELRLLSLIFDKLIGVGGLVLVILFQDDIRRFLSALGHHRTNLFIRLFTGNKKEKPEQEYILPVVMACMNMGKHKVGALIVIEHEAPLDDVARTGEITDAAVSQRLIENIFFKNSPLHDGAMIISKKRIKAAGCILPVSQALTIPKKLGLRHRAAMGITQKTDAHAIIVSEETGHISVAYQGQFYMQLNAEKLKNILLQENITPKRS